MYRKPIVVPPPPRNLFSNIRQDLFITLLPTATILVKNAFDEFIQCRALLDTGSSSNFISKEFARGLNIEPSRFGTNFLSELEGNSDHQVKINIKSRYKQDYSEEITCQIIPEIDSQYPARDVDRKNFKEVESYFLADQNFNISSKVDVMLGNEIAFNCLLNQKQSCPNGALISESKFGWIVSGAVTDLYDKGFIHQDEQKIVKIKLAV